MRGTNSTLFSIVTAVFNDRSGLQRTAESLRVQTCRDFEWIVIDNSSTDGTVDFLKTCSSTTFWVSEADNGIADAWNKGIARSRGRFVVILNAGDTFDPAFLATMEKSATEDRIACCHVRRMTPTERPAGTITAHPERLWRGMHLPHNWCVVPRHFYRELGGYPNRRYGMDFAWFHKYFQRYGKKGFIVVPAVLGTYHLGGISDHGYRASFKENEKILQDYGMNPVLARMLRFAYTTKHAVMVRLRSWLTAHKKCP
jgi:glycosyltransferase involved in cell wall biosynthesis